MFGSLRFGSDNRAEFIDQQYSFLQKRPPGAAQHNACDHCRSKKLRCSGQKGGCNRCKERLLSCMYSKIVEDGRSRRKKQSRMKTRDAGIQAPSPSPATASKGCRNQSQASTAKPGGSSENANIDPSEDNAFGGIEFDGSNGFDAPQIQVDDYPASFENAHVDFAWHEAPHQDSPKLDFSFALTECPPTPKSRPQLGSEAGLESENSMMIPGPDRPVENPGIDWSLSSLDCNIDDFPVIARLSSESPTSSSKMPALPPSGCRCLSLKVAMLEELSLRGSAEPFDKALRANKTYLTRCNSALDCVTCMMSADAVMLLILVYERIIEFCVASVHSCYGRIQDVSSRSCEDHPRLIGYRSSFGDYLVDSESEIGTILQALSVHQVKALAKQLVRLRKPAEQSLEPQQATKLQLCEAKTAALIRSLGTC